MRQSCSLRRRRKRRKRRQHRWSAPRPLSQERPVVLLNRLSSPELTFRLLLKQPPSQCKRWTERQLMKQEDPRYRNYCRLPSRKSVEAETIGVTKSIILGVVKPTSPCAVCRRRTPWSWLTAKGCRALQRRASIVWDLILTRSR